MDSDDVSLDHTNPNTQYYYDVKTQSDSCATHELTIFYMNIRSAVNRWTDFEALIAHLNIQPDVVVLVETWLKDSEVNAYNLENYVAYHCVRPLCSRQGRGGGTSVFVRQKPGLATVCCEKVCLQDSTTVVVKLIRHNLHIIAVYRPEQTNRQAFCDMYGGLLEKYRHSICIGDYNINLNNNDPTVSTYCDTLLCHGYALLNRISPIDGTRGQSIIDHVATDAMAYNYALCNSTTSLSDHNILLLAVQTGVRPTRPLTTMQITDYTAIDCSPDWEHINRAKTFDELNGHLHTLVTTAKKQINKVQKESRHKPWITDDIIALIRQREEFFSFHRRHPSNIYVLERYQHFKRQAKYELKQAKEKYFDTKLRSAVTDSKQLWAGIKEIMFNRSATKPKVQTVIDEHQNILEDPTTICEAFSSYFNRTAGSLYEASTDGLDSYMNGITYTVPTETRLQPVTEERVLEIIDRLRGNAATGSDGISAKFLKRYKHRISRPLTNCINSVIETGIWPQSLKCAAIVPVPKTESASRCDEYRPIAVLCALNMVLEDVIKSWLNEMLAINNIIHPNQFGFEKGSNTETAVLHLTQFIGKSIQDNYFTAVVFLDISKAFDSIDHRILLRKLDKLGLAWNEKKLLESYLSDRMHFVRIGECRSSTARALPIAVPQGSRVGPILFKITMNDLHMLELYGDQQLFADDAALRYKAISLEQLYHDMQSDLHVIEKWLTDNHLRANVNKTKYIVFARGERQAATLYSDERCLHLGDQPIQRVRSITYLGVELDDKLHWAGHVNKVRRQISPYVFALRKARPFISEHTATLIYNAFINSRLSYAAPAWRTATSTSLQPLRVLQHAALKTVKRLPMMTPSQSLFSEKFLSIDTLLIYRLLIFIHKVINEEVKHNFALPRVSDIHQYPTRNRNNYHVGRRGGRTEEANVLLHGLSLFNQLPNDLKQASVGTFKYSLRAHLSAR